MKLYHHPASYNARRAVAVASHVGADVELELVDLMVQEQRSDAFLAINPNGKVPVLVDGELVLWESTAIAHYLAEKTGSDLLPEDPAQRADVLRWEAWTLAHLARATDVFLFENLIKSLYGLGDPDEQALAAAAQQFHACAAVLDAHLDGRTWVAADRLTLADFSLAAVFSISDLTKVPWSDYAHIQRWYQGIEALPAWRETSG